MGRALWTLISGIISWWYGAISFIALVVWFFATYIFNIDIPLWVLILAIIIVTFVRMFIIYYKQYQLLNPDVDFSIQIQKCNVINARWLDASRRFQEKGEFEFHMLFRITNQRTTDTEIVFEVGEIDTDMLIDPTQQEFKLEIASSISGSVPGKNILVLPAGRSAVINLSIYPIMLFEQLEESVRKIGKATRFNVPIIAKQSDGGFAVVYGVIENPRKEFSHQILKEITNWFNHQSQQKNLASGQEIIEYLRWLFEG